MSKKSKKKNNLKEDKIMENNNIEELNQNIEEVTEVTEETTEESTNEVNETIEQVEETVNEVEESTNETEETTEEVTEEVTEPEVIVPNIENNVENNVENNEVIGKISGFEKLYVRKEASKNSEPVGIVTDKDDLSIDVARSTDDFYKVITSNGLEGYCVKEFVKID